MANVYGTEGRLLEQLALTEELSVSQLARATGLSYPTTLYTVAAFPFVTFAKVGREKKVRLREEAVDAVYPFLITLQTTRAKKVQLALACLSRKGLNDALLGGDLALEMQLPVRDAEPDPRIEIRTKNPKAFSEFISRIFTPAVASELTANSTIVQDSSLSLAKQIGLLRVSCPEKLLVDAVAEKQSKVFIENVAEAIANSSSGIDMDLLKAYAQRRGVLAEVARALEEAKEYGFP